LELIIGIGLLELDLFFPPYDEFDCIQIENVLCVLIDEKVPHIVSDREYLDRCGLAFFEVLFI
jgi:hypothetical protein